MNAPPRRGERKPHSYLLLVVIVLLLAAALRIIAIRDAPPGTRFDETFDALMARRILNGERPLYFPDNFGEEPLNQYLQAGALATFGWNDVALRFPSIAFGLIEVAALYALGRRAWNRRAGLAGAALCAVSFWPVFFSRLGIRVIALPAIVILAMLMIWRILTPTSGVSLVSQEKGFGVAAGVLLGLAAYTYTAAWALPALIVGIIVYLVFWRCAVLRCQAMAWVLIIIIASLIACPLVGYLVTHPQAENRTGQVSGPLDALRQGNPFLLVNYTLAAVGMFAFRGDPEWLYNLPGRPIFDPITALVFLVGIVAALRRWRESPFAFVLIWFMAGMSPVLLSWPPASTSHAILAQPAVYLLVGLGLDIVLSWMARLSGRGSFPCPEGTQEGWGGGMDRRFSASRALLAMVVLGIFALNVVLTLRDYFSVWNTSDSIRWEHQATVTAMGRYADAHPELRDVAFMGNAVDYYNPWMKVGNSLTSSRTDVRWFNPARALVWNRTGPMTYYIPFRDPNPVTFNQTVRDMFFGAATQSLAEKLPDGRQVFAGYIMADSSALHAQAVESGTRPYDFDGRLTLTGYEARPVEARPGESVRLLTYWHVNRVEASPLVIFVHLLGPDGKPVAQEDRLDVAPETLHVDDEFMQMHRVTLPGDTQLGSYRIIFGLYSPVTQVRVPVAESDRVELDLIVR